MNPESGRVSTHLRVRRCGHCHQRTLLQPLRVPEVAGYLLCVNPECRRAMHSSQQHPDEFFQEWDGPQSIVHREADAGTHPVSGHGSVQVADLLLAPRFARYSCQADMRLAARQRSVSGNRNDGLLHGAAGARRRDGSQHACYHARAEGRYERARGGSTGFGTSPRARMSTWSRPGFHCAMPAR